MTSIEIVVLILSILGSSTFGIVLEKFAPAWLRNLKIGSRSKELLQVINKSTDKNADLLEFAKKEGLKYAAEQIEKHLEIEGK